MDEETVDSTVPGTSGNKTNKITQRKKAVPTKEKTISGPLKGKKVDKASELAEAPKEKKKTMMDLVCEAIKVSGENRKGVSVQAIKKYIRSKQTSEAPNFNSLVNKALTKGIEKGTLIRAPASKDATGAVGFFRLAKVEAPKRTIKTVKKQKSDEHVSDSEATEKRVKPRKRNLSDTYISEMKASATSTPKPSVKRAAIPKEAKPTKKIQLKETAEKDTSDTKLVVKETKRKSMKSYSSDSEVDFARNKIKTAKDSLKKAKSDKSKTVKADPPSKVSKPKVKKLYSDNEAKAKSGKTKSKKQA